MDDDVDLNVLSRVGDSGDEVVEEAWRPDPQRPGQERFWDGYEWTDQVRPDGLGVRSVHLPEHVPELQRALAAATADIASVEDRLSVLFERSGGRGSSVERPVVRVLSEMAPEVGGSAQRDVNSAFSSGGDADENWEELDDDDVVLEDFHEDPEEFEDVDVHRRTADELDEDDELSDVDAALAAEAPESF